MQCEWESMNEHLQQNAMLLTAMLLEKPWEDGWGRRVYSPGVGQLIELQEDTYVSLVFTGKVN